MAAAMGANVRVAPGEPVPLEEEEADSGPAKAPPRAVKRA
jgi:hypothetical protein